MQNEEEKTTVPLSMRTKAQLSPLITQFLHMQGFDLVHRGK